MTFSLASWMALLFGTWFLFEKSESVASPDTKLRITRWLKGVEPGSVSSWPGTFALMFDHVFGPRHLSWRCFWRSCLASAAAVVILLLLWMALYPKNVYDFLSGQVGLMTTAKIPMILFSIMVLVGNFIPDYLSLLETRAILRWMSRQSSLFAVFALGMLDLVTSVAIVVVSAPVAWELTVAIWFGPFFGELANTSYSAHLFRVIQRSVVDLPSQLFEEGVIWELFSLRLGKCVAVCVPWGVWTYASLFTSVWIWLYAAAGAAVRMLRYVGWIVTWPRKVLDIDARPIASLGWLVMVIESVVFWGAALVMALR